MRVAIIVLNYNGKDCLPKCLRSLGKLRYGQKEIIIVDNGSTDGSLEAAEREFPEFSYIRNGENLGFAKGVNAGMREAFRRGAQWCWLFNPDAEAEEDALTLLIEAAAEERSAGLLSPLIRESGTQDVWFAKGRIDFWRMRAEHIRPSREESEKRYYESGFLTGCALLIRRDVVETIGFLDESFFLYYEDADFSLRARKAGFKTLVVPRSLVRHSERSRSNPGKPYHLVYSGLLFFRKHAPRLFRPYLSAYVTMRRMKNRLDLLLGREGALAVHRAYTGYYGR